MEICQETFDPSCLPFKVTQGHWNRHGSIYDFLSIVTMGLPSPR